MYRKEISLAMSRSYGPGRYDPRYEEGGQDYPIGFVRWTEKRNMEAFLDLLSSGALQLEPLLAHRFPSKKAKRRMPRWRQAPTPGSSTTMRLALASASSYQRCPCKPRPEGQAACGLHRRWRICAGDHLSPSPLLGRPDAGICCHQHGRGCRVGSHGLWFRHAESPSELLATPTWMRFSFLPGTTATPAT